MRFPPGWRLTATLTDVAGRGRVDAAAVLSSELEVSVYHHGAFGRAVRSPYLHVWLTQPRLIYFLHRSSLTPSPSPVLLTYSPSLYPFAFPTQLRCSPQLTPHGLCFDALALALHIRAVVYCRGLRIPLYDSGTVRLQTILGSYFCGIGACILELSCLPIARSHSCLTTPTTHTSPSISAYCSAPSTAPSPAALK